MGIPSHISENRAILYISKDEKDERSIFFLKNKNIHFYCFLYKMIHFVLLEYQIVGSHLDKDDNIFLYSFLINFDFIAYVFIFNKDINIYSIISSIIREI